MSDNFRLLLFDLDATLMLSGGAGMRGMAQAFHDVYGVENAFEGIHPDGKVDPMLFREMAALHNVELGPDEAATLCRLRDRYYEHLAYEMPRSEQALLMPGLPALLDELAALPAVALGLVTGNYERTARIKLARFELNRYFDFGAFGSDHEVRENLPPLAVQRAERALGRSIGLGPRVVIVGDTPRDVDCGKAHGMRVVGVATGSYSAAQLIAAGADAALDDFGDVQRAIATIIG
ncbi:MAG: HAD hydrolase-like protein [Candidatus Alcyoniella australis]|nr:HAD hydrolase-like protein [Candidatus Alcyoniella australis]